MALWQSWWGMAYLACGSARYVPHKCLPRWEFRRDTMFTGFGPCSPARNAYVTIARRGADSTLLRAAARSSPLEIATLVQCQASAGSGETLDATTGQSDKAAAPFGEPWPPALSPPPPIPRK